MYFKLVLNLLYTQGWPWIPHHPALWQSYSCVLYWGKGWTFNLKFFILCVRMFLSVYMSTHSVHAWYSWRPAKELGSLGATIWVLGIKSKSSKEYPVLSKPQYPLTRPYKIVLTGSREQEFRKVKYDQNLNDQVLQTYYKVVILMAV